MGVKSNCVTNYHKLGRVDMNFGSEGNRRVRNITSSASKHKPSVTIEYYGCGAVSQPKETLRFCGTSSTTIDGITVGHVLEEIAAMPWARHLFSEEGLMILGRKRKERRE